VYIQSKNQVSGLVQRIFYGKYILCNHQSNATRKHESYIDFASQIKKKPKNKKLPLCFLHIIREKFTSIENKTKEKYVIVSIENYQENKVENSHFTTQKRARGCKTSLKFNHLSKPLNSAGILQFSYSTHQEKLYQLGL